MSPRTTLRLLALLVALAAVAFIVQGPASPDRTREHALVFPDLAAGEVSLIRMSWSSGQVVLTREAGGWKVGAARQLAAADAVEALLKGLVEVRVGAVVSTNAAKQAVYETDASKGIVVRLEGAGGKVLAAFVIGKRGPDLASCYLRRDGSSDVLLVTRDLRTDFARSEDSWREVPKKP